MSGLFFGPGEATRRSSLARWARPECPRLGRDAEAAQAFARLEGLRSGRPAGAAPCSAALRVARETPPEPAGIAAERRTRPVGQRKVSPPYAAGIRAAAGYSRGMIALCGWPERWSGFSITSSSSESLTSV